LNLRQECRDDGKKWRRTFAWVAQKAVVAVAVHYVAGTPFAAPPHVKPELVGWGGPKVSQNTPTGVKIRLNEGGLTGGGASFAYKKEEGKRLLLLFGTTMAV